MLIHYNKKRHTIDCIEDEKTVKEIERKLHSIVGDNKSICSDLMQFIMETRKAAFLEGLLNDI